MAGWRGPAVGPETNRARWRRRWNSVVVLKDAMTGSWGSVAFLGHGIIKRNGRSLVPFQRAKRTAERSIKVLGRRQPNIGPLGGLDRIRRGDLTA